MRVQKLHEREIKFTWLLDLWRLEMRVAEKEVAEESGVGGFSQIHARLISNTARKMRITRNDFALVSTTGAMGITLLSWRGFERTDFWAWWKYSWQPLPFTRMRTDKSQYRSLGIIGRGVAVEIEASTYLRNDCSSSAGRRKISRARIGCGWVRAAGSIPHPFGEAERMGHPAPAVGRADLSRGKGLVPGAEARLRGRAYCRGWSLDLSQKLGRSWRRGWGAGACRRSGKLSWRWTSAAKAALILIEFGTAEACP